MWRKEERRGAKWKNKKIKRSPQTGTAVDSTSHWWMKRTVEEKHQQGQQPNITAHTKQNTCPSSNQRPRPMALWSVTNMTRCKIGTICLMISGSQHRAHIIKQASNSVTLTNYQPANKTTWCPTTTPCGKQASRRSEFWYNSSQPCTPHWWSPPHTIVSGPTTLFAWIGVKAVVSSSTSTQTTQWNRSEGKQQHRQRGKPACWSTGTSFFQLLQTPLLQDTMWCSTAGWAIQAGIVAGISGAITSTEDQADLPSVSMEWQTYDHTCSYNNYSHIFDRW